jgi:anti-anti-sigma factor
MTNNELEARRHLGEFQAFEAGRRTVVGFDGEQPQDWLPAEGCRKQLLELLNNSQCETLVFDLTGVNYLASSWLELFVAPIRRGVQVSLCSVSPHMESILRRTRLDRLIEIRTRA